MTPNMRDITRMLDETTPVQSRSLSTPTLTPIAGPDSLGAGRMNVRSPDCCQQNMMREIGSGGLSGLLAAS